MDQNTIPTHQLPDRSRFPTQVERISPSPAQVNNDVHRHDFHELFFFATGTGVHMIDLETVQVTTPCLHLVAPGQVHQLSRSANMEGLVVMFAADALLGQAQDARASLFTRADRPNSFTLDPEQLQECNVLVHMLESEMDRDTGPIRDVVESILGILLIKCAHWAKMFDHLGLEPTEQLDPVTRFLDLVDRNFMRERQVTYYATLLSLSADHLNELVKKRLDRTASSVIQERTRLEAKRLLLHAELSIKEVGYSLNMNDPSYFSRWFHRSEGESPAVYRKRIREKYR